MGKKTKEITRERLMGTESSLGHTTRRSSFFTCYFFFCWDGGSAGCTGARIVVAVMKGGRGAKGKHGKEGCVGKKGTTRMRMRTRKNKTFFFFQIYYHSYRSCHLYIQPHTHATRLKNGKKQEKAKFSFPPHVFPYSLLYYPVLSLPATPGGITAATHARSFSHPSFSHRPFSTTN